MHKLTRAEIKLRNLRLESYEYEKKTLDKLRTKLISLYSKGKGVQDAKRTIKSVQDKRRKGLFNRLVKDVVIQIKAVAKTLD